jgi:hypothetical protein
MANHTDTSRFLQAVFGADYDTAAILANLNPPAHVRSVDQLDPLRDCYWSVAAFDPGHCERTLARALGVRALVVDDVGTKVTEAAVELALGPPTAIVETSLCNFQWAYRLSAETPIDAWRAFFDWAEAAIGVKLHGRDAVHLFRLPMGVNTKAGRGGFAPRLVQLDPAIELKVPAIRNNYATPAAGAPAGGAEDRMEVGRLRALMKLVPNDLDARDDWIEVGHGLKALCENDVDGFTVFDEWSEQHASYDAAETRRVWDSLGASGLKSKGGRLKARAEGLNPQGYAALVFDDNPEPPPPVPPKGGVKFKLGKNKEILTTTVNAALALAGLGLVCRYDEFHHRVFVGDERLTDHLVLLLRHKTDAAYGKDFGSVHTGDAVVMTALLNGFNPVTEMLAGAEMLWDGVKRLDRLGPDYFHTEDTELARACFRKVMIAAVRRARRPGCKFDQILVLESPEGWDKSSAWEVLAGPGNFSDADILGKDARAVQEELADVWIHEIADLSGLSRADIEHVKAFASRTNDRARGAYERHHKDQPRQSIEIGTTNSDSYLLSTTGNRRFWPFKMSARVELARLRADRLLLWGEAAAAESLGETLVLDTKLWGLAGDAQEARRAVDPWEDELGNLVPMSGPAPVGCERIEDWNGEQFISNLSVHEYLAGYRRQAFHSGSGRKIAEIMKRLGWERCSRKVSGAVFRGYKRNAPSVTVSKSVTPNPF